MPSYKIHRLKDHLRQYFRHAPHVSGAASVKPRDYNPGDALEAKSPYAAYFELRGTSAPLEPGDLLGPTPAICASSSLSVSRRRAGWFPNLSPKFPETPYQFLSQ